VERALAISFISSNHGLNVVSSSQMAEMHALRFLISLYACRMFLATRLQIAKAVVDNNISNSEGSAGYGVHEPVVLVGVSLCQESPCSFNTHRLRQ
jgi:hypothetical protein